MRKRHHRHQNYVCIKAYRKPIKAATRVVGWDGICMLKTEANNHSRMWHQLPRYAIGVDRLVTTW